MVEVDLVAEFHADPMKQPHEGKADVVIGSKPATRGNLHIAPLFRSEIQDRKSMDDIERVRAEARRTHGWIMDTYLLRKRDDA